MNKCSCMRELSRNNVEPTMEVLVFYETSHSNFIYNIILNTVQEAGSPSRQLPLVDGDRSCFL